MDTRRRVATFLTLWVMVGSGTPFAKAATQSAPAPSICERLVAQMRGSPATVLKDLTVPNMRPWIVKAVSRPADHDPANRYLSREGEPPFSTIESLPRTDLSMASTILGSGDCLDTSFFEWREGGTFRAVDEPPIVTANLCGRLGQWGRLAAVLGQPAFITYGSLAPGSLDSLLIVAPWAGKDWGSACPVSIRFRYRYDVTPLYCRASQEICAAARTVAPQVKRRWDTWSVHVTQSFYNYGTTGLRFQFPDDHPDARRQALVARARRIGMPPLNLAPLGDTKGTRPLRVTLYTAEYFALSLDGNPYVGAASLVRRTSSMPPQWLFVLFQPPGPHSQRLLPLAAVKVHRVTSAVRSITATNESASVSDKQSTRIPVF
jgi:hypothetical protein